jgi:integrase
MTKDRAPGLKVRTNKKGVVQAYWVAAQCTRRAKGYPIKTVPLSNIPPDQWDAKCNELYTQLLIWLNGDQKKPLEFEGTIDSLIDHYERHELSPYHLVKYNSKASYDASIRAIRKTVGTRGLSTITGINFITWHANYLKPITKDGPRRVDHAHRLMSMIRRLFKWGVVLELPHAKRLSDILSELQFEQTPPRKEYMTFEQAQAFIAKANEMGRPSMALGQALQFELTFRQKDVIGEWIPDMTGSGIRHTAVNALRPKRWDNGLTWSHIDSNMVLRKATVKTGQETEFDMTQYPVLMAEIAKVPPERRVGPVIISEKTRLPYTGNAYAATWRMIANAAGIPPEIQNRDSRSGSITEATDAAAGLELVRHHAGHKNASMTARYSKNTIKKTTEVARLRVAARSERGPR